VAVLQALAAAESESLLTVSSLFSVWTAKADFASLSSLAAAAAAALACAFANSNNAHRSVPSPFLAPPPFLPPLCLLSLLPPSLVCFPSSSSSSGCSWSPCPHSNSDAARNPFVPQTQQQQQRNTHNYTKDAVKAKQGDKRVHLKYQ
jgi:hypothetical protein